MKTANIAVLGIVSVVVFLLGMQSPLQGRQASGSSLTSAVISPLSLGQETLISIEPIQGIEYHGQQIAQTLRVIDRTGQKIIEVPAGTQVRLDMGVGLGKLDSSSFRTPSTPYALHAIDGPNVPASLIYSFNRDVPDLTFFPGYTISRRISEVYNDSSNRIAPFVQRGDDCLLIARVLITVGGGSPLTITTSIYFPRPDKNRWTMVEAVTNNAGYEFWDFHHGGFQSFAYVKYQHFTSGGEEDGLTFPIQVDAQGNFTATLTTGSSSITVYGLGFRRTRPV